MLSIAIYSTQIEDVPHVKSLIQDFLIESKSMAKVSVFSNSVDFMLSPNKYDICILDMDSNEDVIQLSKEISAIGTGNCFVYISKDTANAYQAARAQANAFLAKPIEKEDLVSTLKRLKKEIQDESIIIKIPSGERRVRINNLNYINIVKRCLCYHLKDGTVFDGQVLRTSFEKAIFPLQFNQTKTFLFLPPSLLINIGEVKIVNSDNVVFENDDVLFFPKKSHDLVREAWIGYNRIIE